MSNPSFYTTLMPHVMEQQRLDFQKLCTSFKTSRLPGRSITIDHDVSRDTKGILYVHGLGSNRKVWVKCADIARKSGIGVAMFDLAGHGQYAEEASGPFTMDQMKIDVVTVLEFLQENYPHVQWLMVGHSYGANIVLELAARGQELGILGAVCVDGGFISLRDVYQTIEDCKASPLVPPSAFTQEGIPFPDLMRTVRELWLREPREDSIQALLANFTPPSSTESAASGASNLVRTRVSREVFMELLIDLYRHSPRDLKVDPAKASPVLLLPAARTQINAFTKNKRDDVAKVYNGPGLKKVIVNMDCDVHEMPLELPDQLSELIARELTPKGLFSSES
jgi:pimeloyl-ACP methyl ester carboxylesterase